MDKELRKLELDFTLQALREHYDRKYAMYRKMHNLPVSEEEFILVKSSAQPLRDMLKLITKIEDELYELEHSEKLVDAD